MRIEGLEPGTPLGVFFVSRRYGVLLHYTRLRQLENNYPLFASGRLGTLHRYNDWTLPDRRRQYSERTFLRVSFELQTCSKIKASM
jgi:hypothetical protein